MDNSADKDEQTNEDHLKYEEVPPDGGFGWVVVAAAHIAYFLSHGSLTSFGPYIVRLKDYFDEGAGAIGGISGIALLVTFFTGSVSSGLMSRFGCRAVIFVGGVMSTIGLAVSSFVPEAHYLYLTCGLITAFGYSLVVTPVMSLPAKYFRKRYALANGIVFAGIAVAWISLPSLSQLMIQKYGWRGAMLLLSALTANICVCGVILKPPKQRRHPTVSVNPTDQIQSSDLLSTQKAEETTPENSDLKSCDTPVLIPHTQSKEISTENGIYWRNYKCCQFILKFFDFTLFSNSLFVVMFMQHAITGIGFYPTLLFLVARAVSYGISQPLPATLLTIWGVTSLLGRLTHGFIIDRKIVTATQGLAVGLFVCGLVNILSCIKTDYIGMALMYCVFGLSNGVYHPLTTVVVTEYVGSEKFPQAQGMCNLSRGVAGLLGVPITGWLYDATQSYNVCYLFSGCVIILSALLLGCVPFLRKIQAKKSANYQYRSNNSDSESEEEDTLTDKSK